MSNILVPLKLTRQDGKVVEVTFYNNAGIDEVEILDIKKLKFEGMKVKDIKKSHIKKAVFKDKNKVYFQNEKTKIVAALSKTHVDKFISTVFKRDVENRYSYLKKEIISNIDLIFYAAIPILKHPELKSEILYDLQIVHRFALPLKIGGLIFLVMITVKERTDYQTLAIDEFAIYDLYSENQTNEKSLDSSSMVSASNKPVTALSHYQVITYSINDLINFVNLNVTKYQ